MINFLQKNKIGIGIHYNSIQSFKFYKNIVKFNYKDLKVSNLVCKIFLVFQSTLILKVNKPI